MGRINAVLGYVPQASLPHALVDFEGDGVWSMFKV